MPTPRPYQITGRDFLAARRFALLADSMRLGKSGQAIAAAKQLGLRRVLVVCPAIAVPHWMSEFGRWWPEFDGELRAMSYDKMRRGWPQSVDGPRWEVAIVDEAHFAKSIDAKRTKMVYGKDGLGWRADRLWSLSGTPMMNHPGELWPMLKAFGATGMGYREFTDRYCTFNKWTGKIVGTNSYRVPELKNILARVMLRRTLKEVAPELPDIDFQFLNVEPFEKRDLTIPAGLEGGSLVAWLESRPAADREDRQAVAMAKVLPLVEEIGFSIENRLLPAGVVYGWHVEPLMALRAALDARGISAATITGATPQAMRTDIQTRLREGKLQIVAANIMAAGTAIDMSTASQGWFLELDWVGTNNLQAANRLVSMGKTEKVSFAVCTWPGSADDKVQRAIVRKMVGVKGMGL